MGKNQHVVLKGNQWGVKGEGNSKCSSLHDTQKEAIDAGRDIARNQQSELVIQGTNGRIREKNSYGNDPYPPEG